MSVYLTLSHLRNIHLLSELKIIFSALPVTNITGTPPA